MEELVDKNFKLNDTDTFTGLIPTMYQVSDREISDVIYRYRTNEPTDDRSDEELRSYAVNTILIDRS